METAFDHTVLIVDDNEESAKAIALIVKRVGAKFFYARDGQTGLDRMHKVATPFSLILLDPCVTGMEGLDFLAKAKEISPETIRFVINDSTGVQAIIDAVNRGAVHRYIPKPWKPVELMESISKGLKEYELVLENERLFALAKEQNLKLFKFSNHLEIKSKAHKEELADIDRQIQQLKYERDRLQNQSTRQVENITVEIQELFQQYNLNTGEAVNSFFALTLRELYDQFHEIAARNDLKMPDEY
ncbi:putative response regulator receiver (CheY-like) modulated transcriptional activator [Desulforapulum autotrophicum HRM2]|uniref:Response regulator receiver (CheY-like) modulated transcriptional activator n=1 Tax=Desulforapulum autotrophicum (strain ATCC 43914 / DSM 3382 / VKM B-1955 / HRM2) TaxID=177437 RepID=C0QJW0_DESAH|nr:response regulator [Desulforapulum autotrophicum]ACN15986.1 putative response regulator receiver (CheY-like) modulated transcriptional activator [Desulforapulum autotrophicum HRM2]